MEAEGFSEIWIIFYKTILYCIPEAHIIHGICVCVCVCVTCGEWLCEKKTMPLLHEAVVGAHMRL
jgi:hypothetical protein